MLITLATLFGAIVFFVNGKIRADLVGICALLVLMLTGILTPAEALSGFSSSIVIMMVGLFVVGGAIFQTGLAKAISSKLLKLAGNSENKLFLLVMLVTSGIGGFISNTGTVALMLPIVVSLAMAAGTSPSRLLMPLAFASSMGGMMTLIGTPPNLIINDTLMKGGYEGLSFFSFLPIGLICVTTGILMLAPLCRTFLSRKADDDKDNPRGKSLSDLANEYQLSQKLFRARAVAGASIIGKTLQQLEISQRYSLNVLEIRRRIHAQKSFLKPIHQKIADAKTIILESDVLYLVGEFERVQAFVEENKLDLMDARQADRPSEGQLPPAFLGQLRFDTIGIAEVVLLSNSRLVKQPVKQSGFREKYNVNILGIQRGNKYILQNLKDEVMHSGDVLLVQGEWGNIAKLSEKTSEWVVVGQPLEEASKLTLGHKAPIAAGIMVMMVLAMVLNLVPPVIAVMAAALLTILSGCFRNVEVAYKTIRWESVVLFGSMLPMAVALEKTQISSTIAGTLASSLGNFGPLALLAGVYFLTSLLTLFISNTATAALFASIAMQSAQAMNVSPYPFMFAVTIAASMCFASPFSTPPNALVMSAGRYRFIDYVKVGLPLQVTLGIVMVLVLPLLFPFHKAT
ncbi:MAG: SLC13 family permease [Proteobacteria bacterium]|nr:SLC13 family permease [Cystobacterineae bacterium]MCL2314882.1 SLC13 family permease [Pseudomonadota bacterium]